jgi:hypothetical protein
MQRTFSGKEFAEALAAGSLKESVTLIGMVKKSEDDPDIVHFTPGTVCESWVPLPVSMIDRVEIGGKVPCDGHEHDYVRISLKEPSSPEALVLAALLGRYVKAGSQPCGSTSPGPPATQPVPGVPTPAYLGKAPAAPVPTVAPILGPPPAEVVPAQSARIPALQTAAVSAAAAVCWDGSATCYNGRCYACCNGNWYDINTCQYGVYFYCNGQGPYNAYNCWPIA